MTDTELLNQLEVLLLNGFTASADTDGTTCYWIQYSQEEGVHAPSLRDAIRKAYLHFGGSDV